MTSQVRNLITSENIFSASPEKGRINTPTMPPCVKLPGASSSCSRHHSVYWQSTLTLKDVRSISVSDRVTLHTSAPSRRESFRRRMLIIC